MGLGEYGFIDSDLQNLLVSQPPDEALPVIRERVREYLVEQIADSVDRGGTTIGLNLENLQIQHREIAARIHRILELRRDEIQSVSVGVSDGVADLQELYLTAYGYEILSALGMRLKSPEDELAQISEAISNLGFDLKIGNVPISAVEMSGELKKAIWWIVENRGKFWIEIKQS